MLSNHLFCYFLYVHFLRPWLRSLVRRISTRPAVTLPPSWPSQRFPGSTELGEEEEEEEEAARLALFCGRVRHRHRAKGRERRGTGNGAR